MKVLLVDEARDQALGLEAVIRFLGHDVIWVDSRDALADRVLDRGGAAVCLVAGTDTFVSDALQLLWEQAPDLPVFLLVPPGAPKPKSGTSASVLGTLSLPLRQSQLVAALKQAVNHNVSNQSYSGVQPRLPRLVGESRAIQRVRQLIDQVVGTDATVLVLGESGTGKEVVARTLHELSPRRNQPFVPINCGAIPPDLLESELFGHEKGAFTGAISARPGRFEMANGGTIFLDEIGDMSMAMQVKLLRVLQERTIERVGGNNTIKVDVRVIAATHRNLEERIKQDEFREDLFYRLNVFPIEVPPVRARPGDIPVLVEELVRRVEEAGRGSVSFTPAALSVLSQYRWPGNVRELANLVERLAIMYPYSEVDVEHLPEKVRCAPEEGDDLDPEQEEARFIRDMGLASAEAPAATPLNGYSHPKWTADGIDLKQELVELETELIKKALSEASGVVAQAANLLKLRRTTLVEKIRKYGLQRN